MLTIVYPSRAHSAYGIAAKTFASLAMQVSGCDACILTDEAYAARPSRTDTFTVLIGNDAVNDVTASLYLEKKIERFGIRYGTDDYCIRSAEIDGAQYLFLAGGRPRAALYAVYRYFERCCGCRWFWDGDRVPQAELPKRGIDVVESARFAYRGIRYFAHRSLHRFQAEHWSFEDWTREIDWLLKKRLNLFMLRIGMDDVFQRAFPDIVPYPERDERLPEAGEGYDDRTLFWSLAYRGELRRRILQYAFERDLMHPEDCGTMSHWYSRTPLAFLERVKPQLLPQSAGIYNEPTGRVLDIRQKENLDHYFKLTEAHIKAYGRAELFHTIGLGERRYSDDPEENRRMKLHVYRKILTRVSEQYPNAPLLIASWDLWMHFTPEEVRELVSELDPSRAILLDYTSDTVRDNNFTAWGIVNKFPWIFGIFSGYEPNSEIRGFYELTNERLRLAKQDPMCQGLVFWPELSHGDPFAIEYFAQNAWEEETLPIPQRTEQYCRDRYPAPLACELSALWHAFMPIVQMTAWSVDDTYQQTGNDLFPRITRRADFDRSRATVYCEKLQGARENRERAIDVLRRLSRISPTDEMTRRDLYDMARTVIGRYINAAILKAELLFAQSADVDSLLHAMRVGEALVEALADLLGSHEDYSLFSSLSRLRAVTETNPHFEETLKANAECGYCRSYIYENARYLYLPEMKLWYAEVERAARLQTAPRRESVEEGLAAIRQRYFELPLAEMQTERVPFGEVAARAASLIEALAL